MFRYFFSIPEFQKPFSSILTASLFRKLCYYAQVIFMFQIGNFLIIFSENVYWLYAARVLFGFGMGFAMVAEPLFTAEICSDK